MRAAHESLIMKRLFALITVLTASVVQADGNPLAGSAWQLQAIQSMDDAQGTTKVAEPSHFTLEFGRDGRATLRLDCNRGNGTYKVEPAVDGSSGSLTFGPVAATRALCPPPNLDERVARDLAYVRSYLLKDGKLYLSLMADGGIYEWHPAPAAAKPESAAPAAQDKERTVRPVKFAPGKSSTVIKGRIVGRQYIDYQLRAAAGQTMTASLKGSNGANYFNVLPPGSVDVGMFSGQMAGNRYTGMLPTDGVYTLRVYLMRSAARRDESSDFSLALSITGQPLKAVSAKTDALIHGTPYHAQTTAPCLPAYSPVRECDARVIRRGFDGTATVDLRWGDNGLRSILFVKGVPKAADTSQPMSFTRNERGWMVKFGDDEQFEIPEPLVFGG
jgi:heat shock protein HslJ